MNLETKVEQAERRAQQAEARALQAEARAQQAETVAQQHLMQLQAVYSSRSWRLTQPLRGSKAIVRSAIGRTLRLGVKKGMALARRVPLFKRLGMWLLLRVPFLMRLVWRFSETPGQAPTEMKKPIRQFEQLRSVRIMHALSLLPQQSNEGPVTFLEVTDDVR